MNGKILCVQSACAAKTAIVIKIEECIFLNDFKFCEWNCMILPEKGRIMAAIYTLSCRVQKIHLFQKLIIGSITASIPVGFPAAIGHILTCVSAAACTRHNRLF
jgi:hypothetical protein